MSSLLDLDFVSHVSLVDDPAVDDARFMVAKRAGTDGPSPVGKDGRQISSQNLQRLEEVLQSARRGRVTEVEQTLEQVLSDIADPDQKEQSDILTKVFKSMSNGDGDSDFNVEKFTESLSTAVKDAAAEGIQEGLEEADLSGEQSQEQESQTQDGDGDVDQDIMDRIDELEERLTGDGGSSGSEETEGQETETQDGDGSGDGDGDGGSPDPDLEKRLETLEKAVQGQSDRQGQGSILDEDLQEEAESVAKGNSWSFQEAIQKAQSPNQQTQESD